MFSINRDRTPRISGLAVIAPALVGVIATIGLAAPHASADDGDSPPITLSPNFTIPPPSDPVITLPPDITIAPTTEPVITLPADVSIPPSTDPVITLPPTITIVPTTTATTLPPPPPPPPPAPVVPSAPQSLVAKPLDSAVKLTWAAPASNGGAAIDKYAVQRATSAAGPFTNVGTPTSPSFTNSGLTNGTKYYFRVVAHNSAGWSAPSTVVSATPMTWPSAPQSLVATPVKYGIKLTWQAPASNGGSPVTEYRVIVYSADCATKLFDYYVSGTTSTPAFSNGSIRCFRVEAHNAVGGGALSNTAKAKAGRPTPPASCSAYVFESPSYASDDLNVWWTAPSSWGGYEPESYYIIVTDGFFTYEDTVPANDLSTTFYVGTGQWIAKVWAVNSEGFSWPACTTSPVQVD